MKIEKKEEKYETIIIDGKYYQTKLKSKYAITYNRSPVIQLAKIRRQIESNTHFSAFLLKRWVVIYRQLINEKNIIIER